MKAFILHKFMICSAYKHVIRRNEGPAQKERSRTQARSYKMGWNQSFRSIQSDFEKMCFKPDLCLINQSKTQKYGSHFYVISKIHVPESSKQEHFLVPTSMFLMCQKLSRGHRTFFRVLDQLKCRAVKLIILIGWT